MDGDGHSDDNDGFDGDHTIVLISLQPREEFIGQLLTMLKPQTCSSHSDTAFSAEDFDSWEDRFSEEVIYFGITPIY